MLSDEQRAERFDRLAAPHLSAAYNLARWLLKNEHDADDVVQDSCVRAFRSLESFHGDSAKTWLLSIVRNCCFTLLHKRRPAGFPGPTLERAGTDMIESEPAGPAGRGDPEAELIRSVERKALAVAIESLQAEFREVFILRELEGLSYKEIAEVARIPMGTVMSRLSRARRDLRSLLGDRPDLEHDS